MLNVLNMKISGRKLSAIIIKTLSVNVLVIKGAPALFSIISKLLHHASLSPLPSAECESPFLPDTFESVCASDISKLVASYPLKACPLDPVPAKVLKWVIHDLSPILASLVDLSLQTGITPQKLKEALIFLIIKKPHLDPEDLLSNY